MMASLTPREQQVMDLLLEGKSVKQIAVELSVGFPTAARHRTRVLEKMHVHNDVELVRLVLAPNLLRTSVRKHGCHKRSKGFMVIRRMALPAFRIAPATMSRSKNDVTGSDPSMLATSPTAQGCDECPNCRRPLPIRATQPGEVAAHWECAACRAPLTGVLVQEVAVQTADTVRIGQVHFDTTGVPPIPSSLRQLVREFTACRREHTAPSDQAAGSRTPAQFDVQVLPLDENWMPCAKPALGLAIDLTVHGLGMVTPTPLNTPHIAMQIRYPTGVLQLLGEVVWTNQIAVDFYNSGVQFLLRFGRSAITSMTSDT